MAKDAAAIATELRDVMRDGDLHAFLACMAPLYADEIALAHDPPFPTDATLKGSDLVAMENAAVKAIIELIPDYHLEDFNASGEGDTLTVHETRVGTLPNGTVSRIPARGEFQLRDGRITSATLHINMEDVTSFMEAMSAAGFAAPTAD